MFIYSEYERKNVIIKSSLTYKIRVFVFLNSHKIIFIFIFNNQIYDLVLQNSTSCTVHPLKYYYFGAVCAMRRKTRGMRIE